MVLHGEGQRAAGLWFKGKSRGIKRRIIYNLPSGKSIFAKTEMVSLQNKFLLIADYNLF